MKHFNENIYSVLCTQAGCTRYLDKIKNNACRISDANFFSSFKSIFTDTCTCSMFLDTKRSKTRYPEYFFNINSINNNPRLFHIINNSEPQRKWERHSRWLRTLSLIRYFCRMNWSMNSFCSASTLDKASYSIRYLEYTDNAMFQHSATEWCDRWRTCFSPRKRL